MHSVPSLAQQVVGDFGGKAESARQGVRALAAAIERTEGNSASSLAQWTDLFRKTCGQDWPRPKARLDRLAQHYEIACDPARFPHVLFALQSWYILLLELLVNHVLASLGLKPTVAAPLYCGEPFDWMLSIGSPDLERAMVRAAARVSGYDPGAVVAHAAGGGDLLKSLYESLFPRAVRHGLGEYYTPAWLAEHVLDAVGYHGQPGDRVLDPTCGSGTFLLAALRRWRQSAASSASPLRLPPPIVGFDLHPLAVASAGANYLLAIADLRRPESPIDLPVFVRDAILDQWADELAFDFVVGNPPWIAWDNLPAEYRESTKPHWQRYGLFSLSGNEARHGGGKKDLSMLVLYSAADRYLASGGRLGMVITQTLFQTKGAGDGLRRFRLGADGLPLRVLQVDDLVAVRPFAPAANWTSVVVLEKGQPTTYPVPYVKWTYEDQRSAVGGLKSEVGGQGAVESFVSPRPTAVFSRTGEGPGVRAEPSFLRTNLLAQPIDPACPTSPWIVLPPGAQEAMDRLIGSADYTAHLGANSGGANAVYWLEVQGRGKCGVRVRNLVGKAKRRVEIVEAEIEPELIYPLVRWTDVDRWSARPSAHLLLVQDPQTRSGIPEDRLGRECPKTLAYLRQFRSLLTARAAYRRYQDRQPFYSMYNVGPYTLSAAKVIWRRMDHEIRAAVVETWDDPLLGPRPVIPQETCVLIACISGDEAHYLCSLLNSSLVGDLVVAHSVAGGKGFGSPSILDYLPLRKFDPSDGRHVALAALSRQLHALRLAHRPDSGLHAEIDQLAATALVRRDDLRNLTFDF